MRVGKVVIIFAIIMLFAFSAFAEVRDKKFTKRR